MDQDGIVAWGQNLAEPSGTDYTEYDITIELRDATPTTQVTIDTGLSLYSREAGVTTDKLDKGTKIFDLDFENDFTDYSVWAVISNPDDAATSYECQLELLPAQTAGTCQESLGPLDDLHFFKECFEDGSYTYGKKCNGATQESVTCEDDNKPTVKYCTAPSVDDD